MAETYHAVENPSLRYLVGDADAAEVLYEKILCGGELAIERNAIGRIG
jgi:hypothetical protein